MSDHTRSKSAKSRAQAMRDARIAKYGVDPRAARRSSRRSVTR